MYLPENADILPWDTPKASALGPSLVILFLGGKTWLQPVPGWLEQTGESACERQSACRDVWGHQAAVGRQE